MWCLFMFSGGVCRWDCGVSPLVSSVSVLLAHLHGAQARPVFPGPLPHLRPSLPAAAPGLALVRAQHLCLPPPDMSSRRSLLAPSGCGARCHGRLKNDAPPGGCGRHRRWQRMPAEDYGEPATQNQAQAVRSQSCAARITSVVNWLDPHTCTCVQCVIIQEP